MEGAKGIVLGFQGWQTVRKGLYGGWGTNKLGVLSDSSGAAIGLIRV